MPTKKESSVTYAIYRRVEPDAKWSVVTYLEKQSSKKKAEALAKRIEETEKKNGYDGIETKIVKHDNEDEIPPVI